MTRGHRPRSKRGGALPQSAMAVSLLHSTNVAVADDGTSPVGSNEWNAQHQLTLASGNVLGRTTAGSGPVEEIPISSIGVSDGDKGDITITAGVWSIDVNVVTYAKMQDMTANRVLGRLSTTGDPTELTGTQVTSLLDVFTSALKGLAPASGGGTANFLRADGTWTTPPAGVLADGDKGDITVSGGGATWTIDSGAVTYAKMQDVSTSARFIGRFSAGAGDPEELTGTQATSLLDVFTTSLKGVVPGSGGGTANFLRADGTWAAPPGGGGGVADGNYGDITVSGTGTVWSINNDAVSLSNLANLPAATVIGRPVSGSGDPLALNGTQITEICNPFTSTLKGLAPASGGGTENFLRADGTWVAPPGGGGGISDAPSDGVTYGRLNAAWTPAVAKAGDTMTGGLGFGSAVAPGGTTDVSRHLALYGSTFGLSVTSARLNYIVPTGSGHSWYVGATQIGFIDVNGVTVTSGNLIVNKSGPSVILDTPGALGQYLRGRVVGVDRWVLSLGNGTAESGGNAGSDFALIRYSDAGALLGTPFSINRATGVITGPGGSTWPAVAGTLTVPATDAEIRSATGAAKAVAAAAIETASAFVALTDAATVAVDWDTAINWSLTVTANRVIGNPTNGQIGTFRTILVQGNDATARTITFGNQFLGAVPTITDCTSTKWYLLTLFCVSTTHFVVTSVQAK